MTKKRWFYLAGALILLTAVIAAIHLNSRTQIQKGTLLIESAERAPIEITFSSLELTHVEGTLVNGRNERRTVSADGILLLDLLTQTGIADYCQVTVTADDEFAAVVTREEIAESQRAYLIAQADDTIHLVVFEDPDSRRNVSNVVRIYAE